MGFPLRRILVTIRDKDRLGFELALAEYPLLRLLLFTKWFRLAFIGLLLLVFCFVLSLPKIWRVTPPGVYPALRVSVLDLVYAWSLKREALKAMQAGRFHDALWAWQAAMSYNEVDATLVRGLMQCLAVVSNRNDGIPLVMSRGAWLLHLSKTNLADVELVVNAYEKYRLSDATLQWLVPLEKRLSPSLRALYLKVLFNEGRISEYAAVWEGAGAALKSEPSLALYQAAYQAGWGSREGRAQGRAALQAALADPAWRLLANRLQLAVAHHLEEASVYAESLERLSGWGADTLRDHLLYWRLLAQTGRKAEAIGLAQSCQMAPATTSELMNAARTLEGLGLKDLASQWFKKEITRFDYAPWAWVTYGDVLLADQQWEALGDLAVKIRLATPVADYLASYTYYLEGRAELGLKRLPLAKAAFAKIAAHDFKSPFLAMAMIKNLLRLGYGEIARSLLVKFDQEFGENAEYQTADYWKLVFEVANELKDENLFYRSAAKLYQLRPNDWVARNNYAAALITLRRNPAEAIKLTMQLMAQRPQMWLTRLNHSLALLQMNRAQEAQRVIETIDPQKLNPAEVTALQQVRFEICLERHDYAQAQKIGDQMDKQTLFPCEREWIEKALAQIAAASGPAPH